MTPSPGCAYRFDLSLYALHDGMLKPMPGNMATPSLAESFTVSEDTLTYDFVIRSEAKFHSGDSVTAEDVKFLFERYTGTANAFLKERIGAVEIADERHVSSKL